MNEKKTKKQYSVKQQNTSFDTYKGWSTATFACWTKKESSSEQRRVASNNFYCTSTVYNSVFFFMLDTHFTDKSIFLG